MGRVSDPKRKAFFATLRGTKLLCSICSSVEKVSKYIGEGRVLLVCGHERHSRENLIQEAERVLDKKERYE